MMVHLVKIEHQGKTILVEAELGAGGVQPMGVPPIRKIEDTLGAVSDIVVACAFEMSKALKSLATEATRPASAMLELGVKFTGTGDIFVVKATADATLKITLKWQFDDALRPAAPSKAIP